MFAVTRYLQSFHCDLLPTRAKKVQSFLTEKSNKCDRHIRESFLKITRMKKKKMFKLDDKLSIAVWQRTTVVRVQLKFIEQFHSPEYIFHRRLLLGAPDKLLP